ncbi:hypothetical protein [Francisella philomiragia]|uniref:hypothetical protein n=1 Tax=Francisella philomiragia TaxID=28110 RepID=UPI003518F101
MSNWLGFVVDYSTTPKSKEEFKLCVYEVQHIISDYFYCFRQNAVDMFMPLEEKQKISNNFLGKILSRYNKNDNSLFEIPNSINNNKSSQRVLFSSSPKTRKYIPEFRIYKISHFINEKENIVHDIETFRNGGKLIMKSFGGYGIGNYFILNSYDIREAIDSILNLIGTKSDKYHNYVSVEHLVMYEYDESYINDKHLRYSKHRGIYKRSLVFYNIDTQEVEYSDISKQILDTSQTTNTHVDIDEKIYQKVYTLPNESFKSDIKNIRGVDLKHEKWNVSLPSDFLEYKRIKYNDVPNKNRFLENTISAFRDIGELLSSYMLALAQDNNKNKNFLLNYGKSQNKYIYNYHDYLNNGDLFTSLKKSLNNKSMIFEVCDCFYKEDYAYFFFLKRLRLNYELLSIYRDSPFFSHNYYKYIHFEQNNEKRVSSYNLIINDLFTNQLLSKQFSFTQVNQTLHLEDIFRKIDLQDVNITITTELSQKYIDLYLIYIQKNIGFLNSQDVKTRLEIANIQVQGVSNDIKCQLLASIMYSTPYGYIINKFLRNPTLDDDFYMNISIFDDKTLDCQFFFLTILLFLTRVNTNKQPFSKVYRVSNYLNTKEPIKGIISTSKDPLSKYITKNDHMEYKIIFRDVYGYDMSCYTVYPEELEIIILGDINSNLRYKFHKGEKTYIGYVDKQNMNPLNLPLNYLITIYQHRAYILSFLEKNGNINESFRIELNKQTDFVEYYLSTNFANEIQSLLHRCKHTSKDEDVMFFDMVNLHISEIQNLFNE